MAPRRHGVAASLAAAVHGAVHHNLVFHRRYYRLRHLGCSHGMELLPNSIYFSTASSLWPLVFDVDHPRLHCLRLAAAGSHRGGCSLHTGRLRKRAEVPVLILFGSRFKFRWPASLRVDPSG